MPVAELEAIQAVGNTAAQGAQAFSLLSFLVCLVLGYGLKYLWNIVNILQFTIFMLRWRINLPLLTLECLKSLKMLVLFEFIPSAQIIGWAKDQVGLIKESNEDPNAQDGLRDSDTLVLAGIVTLLATLLVLLISKCSCLIHSDYRVFKMYMQVRQKLFYNSIVRYLYTGAIKLQLSAVDTFLFGFALSFSVASKWATQIVILVAIYGCYAKCFVFMRRNREILDRPSTRASYGVLYDGFEPISVLGEIRYVEFYSLTFFSRRAAFVAVTFALAYFPGLQVMAFLQMNIFYLIYLGHIEFFQVKR